ncbi:hypothetical protein ABT008_30360, partial [Micromonospora sp. NPDC002389]|uniref:hypothetical protein n=1 Tax=Micromonospora sp. NPDC002389 TaxID=3154272 RepID=UPI00332ABA24
RLVQLALRGGGPDNITVIIADATDRDIVAAPPRRSWSCGRGNAPIALVCRCHISMIGAREVGA